MTFWELKNQLFDLACFNIYQVYTWQPDFDRNNLTRWVKKGYPVKFINNGMWVIFFIVVIPSFKTVFYLL